MKRILDTYTMGGVTFIVTVPVLFGIRLDWFASRIKIAHGCWVGAAPYVPEKAYLTLQNAKDAKILNKTYREQVKKTQFCKTIKYL